MGHGQDRGAGSPYWHHHSLFSGWEEGTPDKICLPPKGCSATLRQAPPSRQERVLLEDTLTVGEPILPGQSRLPHQSGDTQKRLSSCQAAEDNPAGRAAQY